MKEKLQKYFNLANVGLIDITSPEDCLKELASTASSIADLSLLKNQTDKQSSRAKINAEIYWSTKSDIIRRNLKVKGISFTEKMVEDTLMHMYGEEYKQVKLVYDDLKSDYDLISNLLGVMYVRRDLLKYLLEHLRITIDKNDCLLMNKEFQKYLQMVMLRNPA
jgi:hypothetical protein